MNKKLLIIPITLLTTSLIACSPREASPVYFDQWLAAAEQRTPENDPNAPTFNIRGVGSTYDYGFEIKKEIATLVDGIEATKGRPAKIGAEQGLSYSIHSYVNRFDVFYAYFYLNGTIVTTAYGSGWGAPKQQVFTYTVSADAITSLVSKATSRYNEIKNTQNAEAIFERERAAVSNFLVAMEESSEVPTVVYKDVGPDGDSKYNTTFRDADRSILADLKDMTFTEVDNYTVKYGPAITYYVNTEWTLEIHNDPAETDYSYAFIRYQYPGTYKSYSGNYKGFITYSLEQSKGIGLANKIKAMQEAK